MKKLVAFFCAVCFAKLSFGQAINETDSLALVDLYNSTNGPGWKNSTGWLKGPVKTWYGITSFNGRVIYLQLTANNLNGNLPSSIGNLSALQMIGISENDSLSGNIPATLGNLAALQMLFLNNNSLTGSIPAALGNLTKLEWLFLNENELSGNIPAELGNLKALGAIAFDHNHLSGEIPPSLGELTTLELLYLDNNQLEGEIPGELGNLLDLDALWLNDNKLSGKIPSSFANLTNLSDLMLSNNNFSGPIPQFVGDLPDLDNIRIEHNSFVFDAGLENIASLANMNTLLYAPQDTVPLNKNGVFGPFSVSAVASNGTLDNSLVNDTVYWYKNGVLDHIVYGDTISNFSAVNAGDIIYARIRNSVAKHLTLYSKIDTIPYTLPLNLLTFYGQYQNKNVVLNWQTKNEVNTEYFDVQRSTDGINFKSIATLKATGNSNIVKKYSYTDMNVAALKARRLYYRLHEIDNDGRGNYSKIQEVIVAENSSLFTIFPNPAKDFINIVSSGNINDAQIKITDVSGRILYVTKQSFISSQQVRISVSKFSNEVLIVTIENKDNREQFKVVKE